MQTFTIPYSGRLLVAHMVAYGLGVALQHGGCDAFLVHSPTSLELTPLVMADVDFAEAAEYVRRSAQDCEAPVEDDVVKEVTGNKRSPALRARASSPDGATAALVERERLLSALEEGGAEAELPLALAAGLGAPAVWIHDQTAAAKPLPARGATALDGVPYNIGSDIVRAALRRSLPSAEDVTEADLQTLLGGEHADVKEVGDRHRWSPSGTRIASWCQWLAALGLCMLPVGLVSAGTARTPGYRRQGPVRQLTLPVLTRPVSLARLRALLELQTLVELDSEHSSARRSSAAGRLRALGVREVVTFPVDDQSNGSMVAFSFGAGRTIEL